MLIESFKINSEDLIDPSNDEYVYLPLDQVLNNFIKYNSKWSSRFFVNEINKKIVPTFKAKHRIKSAYFKKSHHSYNISILGFVEIINQVILPSGEMTDLQKLIKFVADSTELFHKKVMEINRQYQYHIHEETISVSEIAGTYFDKDGIWLNQQLKKLGFIYRQPNDGWYPEKDLVSTGMAVSVNYHGQHYVRWTKKGVDQVVAGVESLVKVK